MYAILFTITPHAFLRLGVGYSIVLHEYDTPGSIFRDNIQCTEQLQLDHSAVRRMTSLGQLKIHNGRGQRRSRVASEGAFEAGGMWICSVSGRGQFSFHVDGPQAQVGW